MILNHLFLRSRRQEVGLSQRELGRASNISSQVLLNYERGAGLDKPTLRDIDSLAIALAVEPELLIAGPAEGSQEAEPSVGYTPSLVSLLHRAKRRLDLTAVGGALGLDREATLKAVAEAQRAVVAVGLSISRTYGGVSLVSGNVGERAQSQLREALRRSSAQAPLQSNEATLLLKIIRGRVTAKGVRTSAAGRPLLGRLINAGLVVEQAGEHLPLAVSDDVRRSLLLDKSPAARVTTPR